MGRANLADNSLAEKGRTGNEDDIRPCLRCTKCASGIQPPRFSGLHCAVNPVKGRELQYGKLYKTSSPKKVVIVGGGVAGMEAAQRCTALGHDVVLFEASNKLGGKLHIADAHSFKTDMKRYKEWMITQTEKCRADIRLNISATPEIILAEDPDVLMIAVGAEPVDPKITIAPGKELVSLKDLAEGKAKLGKNIVVAGGGLSGVEHAISLAQEGKKVTILDGKSPQLFLKGNPGLSSLSIMRLIQELKINIIFGAIITEISNEGVVYTDANGVINCLPCDNVINALGMKINEAAIEQFQDIVPNTYLLGDCAGNGMSIEKAVLDAFTASTEL